MKGPLVAECEGVSAEEREAFIAFMREGSTDPRDTAGGFAVRFRGRAWWAELCRTCKAATFWTNGTRLSAPPPCPVCDPIGARAHDARAIDALARELWRARPDVVLAEMDRKLEAAELGGDALEALVAVVDQLGRCEAENERLRNELARVRADAAAQLTAAHRTWDTAGFGDGVN